ncbi:pre-mRNA-splicing factor syf1 [Zopfochytrium polystomum]|nr:pre-mRNA-splicing factor syf1 [Zopfochytrium polystomum]
MPADDPQTSAAGAGAATPMNSSASPSRKEDLFLLIRDDDIVFEEECIRNPYHLKNWLFYIEHKANMLDSLDSLIFLYDRATQIFPASYKLWKAYLDLRMSMVLEGQPDAETGLRTRKRPVNDPIWQEVNGTFERALVLCNKFPIIWKLYCQFLLHQPLPTITRHTFDRALKALPITQHPIIWDLYLKFARRCGGETAVRVWRRYLRLDGENAAEDYVELLLESLNPPRYAEAARVLATVLEDSKFVSRKGKPVFQLWTEFCDLVCEHADEMSVPTSDSLLGSSNINSRGSNTKVGGGIGLVEPLDVEKVIRSGISRFTDQVGRLWNALARWWVARGEFDRATDVYEEAMVKVKTVRDFTMVFDAYAEFEESLISAKMAALSSREEDEDVDEEDAAEQDLELDMRLARLEKLMQRRPFLVNDVILRQNPHNVHEWERRVLLFKGQKNDAKVVETYSEAVNTIAPKKASGKFHLLWANFARFYEDNQDLENARLIFERGVNVSFKHVDDLSELWCQWAEMELRNNNFQGALDVMGMATRPPRLNKSMPPLAQIRYQDETLPPQTRLFKSMKLWSFYVDLEESIGTVEGTKAVYDRIMDLKIATPQIILNCAAFLEDQNRFEESYTVYERGIELFGYPIAFEIWNVYLQRFVTRNGSTKLERARDLFEHAVDKCPAKFAKVIYLMYAKLEEDYGLARHAMKVYDRATKAVGDEDRFEVFTLYISKAVSFFGLTASREIYERAIEMLPDRQARDMCVRFAQMEIKLMEVDRARSIWSYGSQFADPRMDPAYWKSWQDFEVKHGNEDTFKEMLRIKRSVQAKFNTDVGFISAQLLAQRVAGELSATDTKTTAGGLNAMAALEEQTRKLNAELDEEERRAGKVAPAPDSTGTPGTRVIGFVPARARGVDGKPLDKTQRQREEDVLAGPDAANPDEIEIDDDEESENGAANGSQAAEDANDSEGEPMDAEEARELASVKRKAVPDAVFGGLAHLGTEASSSSSSSSLGGGALGAKERFKRKR